MTDLGTTVAGVALPFAAMNAAGTVQGLDHLKALAASRTGAVVLQTATVHPFVHPEFRALHNPGFDKLAPLARELVTSSRAPVVASVAGGTPDELALLARAFGDAGVALIEANLAEPYVAATLGPFDVRGALDAACAALVAASPVPVVVRIPTLREGAYRPLADILRATGVRGVVVSMEFEGLERFLLEGGAGLDAVAVGAVRSGYDVTRALAKGARAVQVLGPALAGEGVAMFLRLEREMRIARGERDA